jgi:hypothetical protein
LWQISPHRAPEPDPQKGSNVKITFTEAEANKTKISLQHSNFQNRGNDYQKYIADMNAEYGWEFILGCLKKHAEKQ